MVQVLTAPVAEYLERVRFGWERDLNDEVRRWSVASAIVRRHERVDEILGLQITETLSPRVCGLARSVASTLRVDPYDFPYELYQVRSFTMVNGQAYTARLPHAICLVGDAVGILADDELAALLGHEFGHCLAHAATGDSLVMNARQHSLDEVLNHQCRVAGELTADRFGLLAVQDLDAAPTVCRARTHGPPTGRRATQRDLPRSSGGDLRSDDAPAETWLVRAAAVGRGWVTSS